MGWPPKSAGISRWPGERPGWDANGAERGRRRELEVNSSAPVRVLDEPHLSIGGCQMSFTPHVTRRTVVKLGPLGGHKVHKMVKFRPRGMVDKREMEQAQLFETADERGCTPMFGAAHRRASAVPYPRRYEGCSLSIARTLPTDRPFALTWSDGRTRARGNVTHGQHQTTVLDRVTRRPLQYSA